MASLNQVRRAELLQMSVTQVRKSRLHIWEFTDNAGNLQRAKATLEVGKQNGWRKVA